MLTAGTGSGEIYAEKSQTAGRIGLAFFRQPFFRCPGPALLAVVLCIDGIVNEAFLPVRIPRLWLSRRERCCIPFNVVMLAPRRADWVATELPFPRPLIIVVVTVDSTLESPAYPVH